ncbi:MAG: hypothetical protein JXR94_20120 [Candidatus Hydrogenedentes bacterium]|nr:hypothetical protein [Candidatus Hydrogenedentota bacterium]
MTKRERAIALATLTIALAACLYVFAIEPLVLEWQDARARARAAEQELAQLRLLVENRTAIEREYLRLKDAVTTGSSEQELQVALFNEVSRLASECGLELSTIRPLAVTNEAGFSRCGIELQIHCEHHEFVNLLHRMQDRQHLLHIDHISLAVGPGKPPITVTMKASKLAMVKPASQRG